MTRVWDGAVRALHWALVLAVAAAWLTTEWFGGWHRAAGWLALAIVVARMGWGWLGPGHARFARFVRTPRATLAYARSVLLRREPRYLGHNPLGACMVLAFFACTVLLALTGWLYTTDRFWGNETVEDIHRWLAWSFVLLAAMHVAGIAYASLRHHENLVGSMLSGDKRAPRGSDIG